MYVCIINQCFKEFYCVRFMAEPDLSPLVLAGKSDLISGSEIQTPLVGTVADVDKLQNELPELPMQTRLRLNTQYGIVCGQICLKGSSTPKI